MDLRIGQGVVTVWCGGAMRATEGLHDEGQSRWLDNVTRRMLGGSQ
jgi:hypothetical protein